MFSPASKSHQHLDRVRQAQPGEVLFLEGDPSTQVFELLHGIVRGVSISPEGERQIAAFFFAGDQIGLPIAQDYRFTAEAVTQVSYLRRAGSDFPPRDHHRAQRCAGSDLRVPDLAD